MRSGLFLFVLIFSVHSILFSQPNPSAETAVKIKQVENGLFERLLINGKTYTVQERMKYHKVNGVSIAVIDNY